MTDFTPFPALTTARLTLRQLIEPDALKLSLLRSDERVNKYLDRPRRVNMEEAMAFIRKISEGIKENKLIYWAICTRDNPALIGTICLWNFSDDKTSAEVGYELSPAFHGQGFMNESLNCILDYGFNMLKIKTINAYVHKNNDSSTGLLLRNNFKLNPGLNDKENNYYLVYSLTR